MVQAKENKIMTTLRLSPRAKRLLLDLAGNMGLSQGSVMEIAVRDLAAKRGAENRGTENNLPVP